MFLILLYCLFVLIITLSIDISTFMLFVGRQKMHLVYKCFLCNIRQSIYETRPDPEYRCIMLCCIMCAADYSANHLCESETLAKVNSARA